MQVIFTASKIDSIIHEKFRYDTIKRLSKKETELRSVSVKKLKKEIVRC